MTDDPGSLSTPNPGLEETAARIEFRVAKANTTEARKDLLAKLDTYVRSRVALSLARARLVNLGVTPDE